MDTNSTYTNCIHFGINPYHKYPNTNVIKCNIMRTYSSILYLQHHRLALYISFTQHLPTILSLPAVINVPDVSKTKAISCS